jgi:hypothetical protein
MKRTLLRRRAPLRARTPLRRRPIALKLRVDPPELVAAKQVVRHRSGGRCEARWENCTGRAEHAHHRLRRSQGGGHTPENLLDVCGICHLSIHSQVARAVNAGFLVRSTATAGTRIPAVAAADPDAHRVVPQDVKE